MSYVLIKTEIKTSEIDGREYTEKCVWDGKAFTFGGNAKIYSSLAGAKRAAKRAAVNPYAVKIEEI